MTVEVEVDPTTGLVRRPPPNRYPLGPTTVAALLDGPVASSPDRVALVDGDRTWTYAELDAAAGKATGALLAMSVGAGDRVAWSLPNSVELAIGFLATQRLGAVWLGVNPTLAPPEQQYLLDDSAAKAHIFDGDDWQARIDAAELTDRRADIDPHAPAAIAYTSGTTGTPKGAVHSQHNLIWPGLVTVETHPPKPADREGTPLAHTILNMLVLGVVSAWVRGTTAVILHRRDAAGLAEEITRHRITRTLLVPTQIHDLVHDDGIAPEALASLESVIVGGAPTPGPLRRAFEEKFGIRAVSGYGLSEAPSGIVRESADEPIDDTATGYPMAPFDLTIIDDEDRPVPTGEEGEICVGATTTGPWAGCWTPMLGYWERPDDTRHALRGGVLHTGDIGSLDERGRLTVRGRRSEMILRGGANVHPVEVETVLGRHPHVAEAAVLGVADERLGQRVAAVITSPVATPDAEAIRVSCAGELAAYKIPDAIAVVDEMPKNAMGKIVKPELAAVAAEAVRNRSTPR